MTRVVRHRMRLDGFTAHLAHLPGVHLALWLGGLVIIVGGVLTRRAVSSMAATANVRSDP